MEPEPEPDVEPWLPVEVPVLRLVVLECELELPCVEPKVLLEDVPAGLVPEQPSWIDAANAKTASTGLRTYTSESGSLRKAPAVDCTVALRSCSENGHRSQRGRGGASAREGSLHSGGA